MHVANYPIPTIRTSARFPFMTAGENCYWNGDGVRCKEYYVSSMSIIFVFLSRLLSSLYHQGLTTEECLRQLISVFFVKSKMQHTK